MSQMELIDRYIDIASENRLEAELVNKLKTNASLLVETVDNLNALNEELNDPDKGKAALEKERDRLREQLKNPIFTEFPKWEAEDRFITQTIEGIDNSQLSMKVSIENTNIDDYFPGALESTSPNFSILSKLNEVPKTFKAKISSLQGQLLKDSTEIKAQAQKIHDSWDPSFSAKKKEYDEYLKKLGADDINKAQRRLRTLNARLADLAEIEKRLYLCPQKEQDIGRSVEISSNKCLMQRGPGLINA